MPEIQQFARRVVEQNIQNLVGSAGFSRRSFTTVYLMYVIMFVVGVGAAVVAVIRGFTATTAPESVTSFCFCRFDRGLIFHPLPHSTAGVNRARQYLLVVAHRRSQYVLDSSHVHV
jgi:hypothetical protein